MDEGGTQRQRRGVADAQVEDLGRREDAIMRRSVGNGIADNFANLDTAYLVQEEHRVSGWRGSLLATLRDDRGRSAGIMRRRVL